MQNWKKYPEGRALHDALFQNRARMLLVVEELDDWMLEYRPDRRAWLKGNGGEFTEALNAFHEALWRDGSKVCLRVMLLKRGHLSTRPGQALKVHRLKPLD